MNSETFGEQIRRVRQEKRLSLRQLASKIDFDQSTLSKIERNEAIAPSKLIKPLSKHLSINYKELQIKYLSERLFYELKNEDYGMESIEIAKKRLEKERSGKDFYKKAGSCLAYATAQCFDRSRTCKPRRVKRSSISRVNQFHHKANRNNAMVIPDKIFNHFQMKLLLCH